MPGSVFITGTNEQATMDGNETLPTVWETFTIAECADVRITFFPAFSNWNDALPYVGTTCPFEQGSIIIASSFEFSTSGGSVFAPIIQFNGLAPGTYYIPIPRFSQGGSYSFVINATAAACNVDCMGVVDGPALPGSPCDDGQVSTINDTWNGNCVCSGTAVYIDCLGVPNGPAFSGVACDDGDPLTLDDVWNTSCICAGVLVIDCLGAANGPDLPGTDCDDDNPATINDQWTAECNCAGVVLQADCLGNVDGTALPGTPCNDGILATTEDEWSNQCLCLGYDCAAVLGGTALPGTACDDNDPLTSDAYWTTTCNCVGVVGIEDERTSQGDFLLAPNPSENGSVRLYVMEPCRDLRVKVMDARGRLLASHLLPGLTERSATIDLSSLSSGCYMLLIEGEGRRGTQRLMIAH